jgi:hypothetical protein
MRPDGDTACTAKLRPLWILRATAPTAHGASLLFGVRQGKEDDYARALRRPLSIGRNSNARA